MVSWYDEAVVEKAELLWNDETLEHIWTRHHLYVEDVEEAYNDPAARIHPGEYGRQKVYGRTEGGRYLTIIIDPEGPHVAWLITARDMTKTERTHYERLKR